MSNKMYSFRSHKCFYEYINKFLPLFEVRKSIARGRFTFVYDGEIKPYRNFYQFLGELNTLVGKDLFIINASRINSRTSYKVFVDEVVELSLLDGEDTSVAEVKEVLVGTGEAVMPSHYAPVIQEYKEEAAFVVDWNWIESLEDTPENKLALDEYAEKNSNVKLKRNMKLANMVRAYKKALA